MASEREGLTRGVHVLVNPESAGGRTRARWPEIARALEEALGPFTHRFTDAPRHAAALTREGAGPGVALVVSVGGDGTHGEVVDGLLSLDPGARPALGIVPSGTGQDLARSLGLPREIRAAIACLAAGRDRRIDAGRVTFATADGGRAIRHFVNVADCGLGGDVVARVNRSRKTLPGKAAFFLATVAAMLAWRNAPLRAVFDGGAAVWDGVFRELVIANGGSMGGGMAIAPGARMDDGRFDVVGLGDLGLVATLSLAPAIYGGRPTRNSKVVRLQAARIEVASPGDVPIAADGELLGRLPATFEILPGALAVRMPAGA